MQYSSTLLRALRLCVKSLAFSLRALRLCLKSLTFPLRPLRLCVKQEYTLQNDPDFP